MADYTLKIRRYDPESGNAAYWQDFAVDLALEAFASPAAWEAPLVRDVILGQLGHVVQAELAGNLGLGPLFR